MTMLQSVLSALIRSGKVTVEITGMDMDELKKTVWNEAVDMLEDIEGVAYADEMTDREKVEWIQKRLENKELRSI